MKIRKVEIGLEEFLPEVERIISVDEKIPALPCYLGTRLKTIVQSLGIKEIDFWECAQLDKPRFKNAFIFYKETFKGGSTVVFRRMVFEKLFKEKMEELVW